MPLETGIVGPPQSGKTTLFTALTRARGTSVGMAEIPDERLVQVAEVERARKVTPAALRVVDVQGTGPQLLGNLRQVDALLAVLDAFSGTRDPQGDLETLRLELLVADRDHVERRLDRVRKEAKSGEAGLRRDVEELERVLAHVEAGEPLSAWDGALPAGLEPLTTKPLIAIENGLTADVTTPTSRPVIADASRAEPATRETGSAGGALPIDLKLEAELVELSEEEAEAFRTGRSALEEVVVRLKEALDLVSFITASDREARAWTLRRGQTALDAAEAIHSDIARGFIRCEVIHWRDLVECGTRAEVARRGLQRLEGRDYVVRDGDVLNIRFNV